MTRPRRRAGRKAKLDIKRQPNGEPSRSGSAARLREQVETARARQAAVSGRADLPGDVLGILHGHDKIDAAAYSIGRKLAGLMARVYDAPPESGSAMFRETVSSPNAEDAETPVERMSDEDAKEMFMRMDGSLRRLGLTTRDLVISAVRYNRPPASEREIGFIADGLKALAGGFGPKEARSVALRNAA